MPEEIKLDLDDLERKARAADAGPWIVHADGMERGSPDRTTNPGVDTADGQVICWWGTGLCGIPRTPNAEFIAATDPTVVLALIAEVKALRQDAERYRWLCEQFGITRLPCAIERILGGEVYVADGKTSIDVAIDSAMSKQVAP